MLDDHGRGAVELEREQPRGREVAEVVERERLALDLLDPCQEVGARAALRVVGGALVRVLAVGEVEVALEHGDVRLGEVVLPAEPGGHRGVVCGGRLKGRCGERPARPTETSPLGAKLAEHRLVVLGSRDRHDVGVVLRGGTQERRAADVDLLDRVLPRDVEPADGALERVEVDADEVDRRDPVGCELRHVLGHVAARQDPSVDGRVQRHDPVAQQLRESGQLLEPRHRHALVGKRLRGPGGREHLDAERHEVARESGDAGLVVDREERATDRHAAISSLTTWGSSRCSTAWTRARSVSGVSSGSTGTCSARITGPVSIPSSTQWTVAAVSVTPAASTSSIGCAPGTRAAARSACSRPAPEDLEEAGTQQVHVAGEDDELDAALPEPQRERLVALLAAPVRVGRAKTAVGMPAARPARAPAHRAGWRRPR